MSVFKVLFLTALVLALAGFSAGANTDLLRLDMSSARGRRPSRPWVYPRGTRQEAASPDKPVILCTDSTFPNDFSCDMRALYSTNVWKTRDAPDIYDFIVTYKHPKSQNSQCKATFLKPKAKAGRGDESPLRLSFSSAECKPSVKGVPALPPALRLAGASGVTVVVRKPDDYYFSCSMVFLGKGLAKAVTNRRTSHSVVKFEYDTTSCVSPIAEGRSDTPVCEYDSRRCRPVVNDDYRR